MPHAVRITGRWVALLTVAALLVGCSGSDSSSGDPGVATTDTLAPGDTAMLEPLFCDPLDERACLLPWPNDAFTRPDDTTPTGRRLDILDGAAPQNVDGVPIDLTDQNRADGFSPGSSILAFVPMLDVKRTGIAPSTDIGASLNDDAPIVILDTVTGTRVAYWAELDATGPADDQVLIVHPAEALAEGHHFIVALRNLLDFEGRAIQRTPAFQAILDGAPEPPQRAYPFRDLLAALDRDGIGTPGLYLAWDFTVASAESLSGRLLHMRSETYDALGADGAPAFTATMVFGEGMVRWIDGTFEAPNYLTGDGSPGSRFDLGADGLPTQNDATPTLQVPFRCLVPMEPTAPVTAIVYGHGLMSSRDEVNDLEVLVRTGGVAACATDEIGMSAADVPNLAAVLADLSQFPEVADRLQQGHLHQQLLGRLLNSPTGFVTSPLFQTSAGAPIIANGATQFVGNSQGGILGGAASAISTEWNRVVLGVPGTTYSLLLPRSSDWPQFATVFDQAYPDPADRLLAMQLIQLLWDRGENNGYAQHLTSDPYPGIQEKQVLLVEAFGDHQVANVSTEVLARTINAVVYEPSIADGRSNDVDPQWQLAAYRPGATAILVVWDYGTPAPPTVNLPPTSPEYGDDPHGAGSREPRVLQQALVFLLTGELLDVCQAQACTSGVLSG